MRDNGCVARLVSGFARHEVCSENTFLDDAGGKKRTVLVQSSPDVSEKVGKLRETRQSQGQSEDTNTQKEALWTLR